MTDDIQIASTEKDADYCILKLNNVPAVHFFFYMVQQPLVGQCFLYLTTHNTHK